MKNIVTTYAEKFRQDRQKQLKLAAVLAALAVVVAGIVFWQLHSTGVAMSNEVYCGMEEHVHDDSCYEKELICGSEDEDHVHDDSCYATVLICDFPEHTHTVECLTDETADVETASDWEETLPSMTGIWSRDVAAVAASQIGYTESMLNYTLAEDGETHQGYSRYGAWYGNEYGDWDAMFASFCLNYAGVPEEEFPEASGAYAWTADLSEMGLFAEDESFTPSEGDLIFFDDDLDGEADRAGVVVDTDDEEETITVIEGNSNDSVEENVYDASDNRIMGFGLLPEQDLDGETVYTVEYDSNEAEYLDIDGPGQVLEDGDLTFFVTVDLNDGYDITEATVNGEELEPVSITASEDGQIFTYEYTVENVEENMAVFLAAKQVIDGSGSIPVYEKADSYNFGSPDYKLTVSHVPTNTKISLDSPHISIDLEREDMNLSGNLKYISTEDTTAEISVEYLMLDGPEEPADENSYTVTPYADGEALNMETGILIIDTGKLVTLTVDIWPIQTNTLCTQKGEDKVYTQTMIGAKTTTAAAQNYTVVGSVDDIVKLTDVAGDNKTFYYGTIGNATDDNVNDVSGLISFESARIVKDVVTEGENETVYRLLPLDAEGKIVEDFGSIYMVNDRVFSFDVIVNSIVNEHTEDNGDVYLWKGTTYYVDQYFQQGTTSSNYTAASTPGVWVQLANIREPLINNGTKKFSDYESVSKSNLKAEGVTEAVANAVSSSYNYGIAGPYTVDKGATDVKTDTYRVTGHIGDEFTAAEEFGTSIVYVVRDDSQFHSTWIDLGAHASDGGTRSWWYWISDYYQVNNYEDEVEYVKIKQNEDGEVHLMVDELGTEDDDTHLHYGEELDIWSIVGLFTKRDSVILSDLLNNQSKYTADGVGFYANGGNVAHIQLRLNGAVETIINGEKYIGELKIANTNDYKPHISGYVTLSTSYTYDDKTTNRLDFDDDVQLDSDNSQEAKIYYFKVKDGKIDQSGTQYYVSYKDAFETGYEDTSKNLVSIHVLVYYTGTLVGEYGDEIEFTDTNPYKYEETMTADQLREAYDTCPNSCGYDIAVNISDAVKANVESSNQIMIYKIWDDDSNAYGSRNNVDYVSVYLQRSKKQPADSTEEDWEDVPGVTEDADGNQIDTDVPKVFQIRADANSSTADMWSMVIYSNEINLTYEDENEDTAPYYFRIKPDSETVHYSGSSGGYNYTGTYDGLTVTNTLDREVITIEGVKNWLDAEGNPIEPGSSTLPESVIIAVYQDDQFYEMQEVKYVDTYDAWAFEFDGLPQYRNDQADSGERTEYEYTLYELAEDGTRIGTGDEVLLGHNWFTVKIGDPQYEENSDTVVYEITNQIIAISLPVTGGTGTWIFTAAGVCLIGGAAAALIYRKRRAVRP